MVNLPDAMQEQIIREVSNEDPQVTIDENGQITESKQNEVAKPQQERQYTARELFCKRMGIDMWEDPDIREEEGLLEHLTEAEKADIERRVTLFDVLSREFTCELGKVGYTIEHLTINYLIYMANINSNHILFNIITIITILFDTLSFNQIFSFVRLRAEKNVMNVA